MIQETLDIEKARVTLPVGTRRIYSGITYVKVPTGEWKAESKVGHLYPDPHAKTATVHEVLGLKSKEPEAEKTKEGRPKKEKSDKTKFPKLFELSYSASLGGSSDVKLMSTSDGEKYAVKAARTKDGKYVNGQLEQEKLTDDIYKLLGFGAPDSVLEKEDGKVYKISKFIPGCKEFGSLDDKRLLEAKEVIKQGFVLDCLLGNWDVIGANGDNILITELGEAIRVDNGGALEYRAKGRKKDSFGPEVTELETFLDHSKNPVTADIYSGITPEQIKRQATLITNNATKILGLCTKFELDYPNNKGIKNKLEERINWLQNNIVNTESKEVKPKGKGESYDKTKYSSKVTQDYFSDWDSFELEGNPGIKEGIKKHILEIEKRYESTYERYAKNHGITVGEYKKRLQDHIEKLMSESEYFRMTDINILDKILVDHGRFKTLFETGTSHGSTSTSARSSAEKEYFAFPKTYDKEKRPVYGYCSNNTNGINNSELTTPPRNQASQYGQVTIKIKKDVALKKATVCFKDSLGYEGGMAATPVAKPHFTSFYINGGDPLSKDKYDGIESTGKRNTYTEIQYHNQLTFNDIESVHMSINEPSGYSGPSDISRHVERLNKTIEIGRKTNVPIKLYGKE